MSHENPEAFLDGLISEIEGSALSGQAATIRLFQEGISLEDTERALRAIGFQAYADAEKKNMSVSVERFTGNVHPIVPRSYETKIITFQPEDPQVWLKEIE